MQSTLIHTEDTIVAPATAAGIAALAILRVSGPRAFEICEKVFTGKKLSAQKTHTLHYGHIVDGEEVIDEVMISLFRAPRSFTAENSVEISCHGSPFIQRRILQVLVKHGARMATAGEFSMRAYLNGRIDLAQAEAIADTIHAENESQLKIALNQMRGGLSEHLAKLRTGLLDFISLVELELDFGEEDVEFADRSSLKKNVLDILASIEPVIDSFKYGNAIRNGIPVAIVGRPNAGKSSLLNALLNDERAIVSEIAGTTRDTIEEEIHIKGISFRFIDTAGIRDTEDSIEKIGIGRALKKIEEAGMVLYIFDLSQLSTEQVLKDLEMIKQRNSSAVLIVLANKEDLAPETHRGHFKDSLLKAGFENMLFSSLKQNADTDVQVLKDLFWDLSNLGSGIQSDTIISNERHHRCLLDAREALQEVIKLMDSKASSDLLALEMKRGIQAIGDITGLISNDEILGNIFGKFCIGK